MRVLRSSLFVAATALVVAACGDKVNVTPPAVIPPTLHGIVVAPATATITVGQTVQLTAAVSADAGVTATVTWTTTNSGVAGVTQSGMVNGASPGTAGICAAASATGLTTVSNCAQVVVQPVVTPPTGVKAVLQIASITTQAGGLNTPVPIPPGVIGGQINVSLNVTPGNETMDSVWVYVDGKPAARQIFTASQAAVLRSALNEPTSAQALQATLVFPINTAAYDTTSGVPSWLNGMRTISAIGFGHFVPPTLPAAPQQSSATQSVQLNFFNPDAWAVKNVLAVTTTNTATSATGYTYKGGPLAADTVKALPIMYSGLTVSKVVINFGTAACDASGIQRTKLVTVGPTQGALWVASFARTATNAGTAADVNGYAFNAASAAVYPAVGGSANYCNIANSTGGEGPWISTFSYINATDWVPALTIAGVCQTINAACWPFALGSNLPVVRLDNLGPPTPSVTPNPNGRANGWLNDVVLLNGLATVTADAMITGPVTDLGVGMGGTYTGGPPPPPAILTGYYLARAGATEAASITAANITSTSTLNVSATQPGSVNNTSWCLTVFAVDPLQNVSTAPGGAACTATGSTLFGVDRVPPVIVYTAASIADLGRYNVPPGKEFEVQAQDTGAVGNSGLHPVNPVLGLVSSRNDAGAGCYIGTVVCGLTGLNPEGGLPPLYNTAMVAGAAGTNFTLATNTGPAYYTFTSTAYDAAGNSTVVKTGSRTIVIDKQFPAASTAAAPITVTPAAGFSVSSFLNSDLDIQAYWFTASYATTGGGGWLAAYAPARWAMPSVPVNGWNATPFIWSNYVATSSFTLPYILEQNMTNDGVALTSAALVSAIQANVMNQSNLWTTSLPVSPNPTYTAPTGSEFSFTNWTGYYTPYVAAGITGISSGILTAATAARPSTVTVSDTLVGATAVFNNPFLRVDVYGVSAAVEPGTLPEWRLLGSIPASAASLIDNGSHRTWYYSISLNGLNVWNILSAGSFNTLQYTPANFGTSIVMVGVSADGTVAMLPAGVLGGLTVVY